MWERDCFGNAAIVLVICCSFGTWFSLFIFYFSLWLGWLVGLRDALHCFPSLKGSEARGHFGDLMVISLLVPLMRPCSNMLTLNYLGLGVQLLD